MRTASERRAAGEAAFCTCSTCVNQAGVDLRFYRFPRPTHIEEFARGRLAALLRALVVQTLLDPATWARPAGWRP